MLVYTIFMTILLIRRGRIENFFLLFSKKVVVTFGKAEKRLINNKKRLKPR